MNEDLRSFVFRHGFGDIDDFDSALPETAFRDSGIILVARKAVRLPKDQIGRTHLFDFIEHQLELRTCFTEKANTQTLLPVIK